MLGRIFAAVVLSGGAIVCASSPASAAYSDCPVNRYCVWTGPNGTGAMATFASGDADLSDSVGPTGMNDNIESYRNRTGDNWCLYNGTGFNGPGAQMTPGQVTNGANVLFPNTASSLRKISGSTC